MNHTFMNVNEVPFNMNLSKENNYRWDNYTCIPRAI